jgi:hypothetical protein
MLQRCVLLLRVVVCRRPAHVFERAAGLGMAWEMTRRLGYCNKGVFVTELPNVLINCFELATGGPPM